MLFLELFQFGHMELFFFLSFNIKSRLNTLFPLFQTLSKTLKVLTVVVYNSIHFCICFFAKKVYKNVLHTYAHQPRNFEVNPPGTF